MTKYELIVPYKGGGKLFVFFGLVALVLMMLLLTGCFSLGLIFSLSWFPGEAGEIARNTIQNLLMLFVLIPMVVAVFLFLTSVREGNKLFLSERGLSYPVLGRFSLGRLKLIHWRDVYGISLSTDDPSSVSAADKICLRLQGGEAVCFALSGFSPAYQEQFLLSIDSFARRAEKDSNFYQYQRALQTKAISAEELSYTSLWQDELNRRFQSTNFAPLRPGASLKSGMLSVVRQLSFGGFCAVYLVKDQAGKNYVLKELMIEQASGADSQKARELFDREAAMLMDIDHPQIVRCFEQFGENERDYLLLDYLPGVNLRQKVGYAGAFAASEVLELAFQMVSMLDYLHSKEPPIVHRDFTPDNLILNESNKLILIDFGAANYFLREATGTLIGKQAYMPPEQLRGKAVPQSDFYALGCSLNFLLTGEDPVALLPSRPSILTSSAVSHGTVNGIAKGLADLVFKLTQLDVLDRPASCGEIKLLLANVAETKVADSPIH